MLAFEEVPRHDRRPVCTDGRWSCALHHNAAACILTHNHPSGDAEPSGVDRTSNKRSSDALRCGRGKRIHMIIGATAGGRRNDGRVGFLGEGQLMNPCMSSGKENHGTGNLPKSLIDADVQQG